MKKIKIICNPSSGRETVQKDLDYLVNLLLDDGYIIGKFNTQKKNDAMNETIKACKEDWDMIIACGGDGTVNEVAAGIAMSEKKLPVAILSAGTVNDFANHMKIPKDMHDFHRMIKNENTVIVDLGKVNNKYFVNVAASGILTDVGYKVAPEAKAIFGRMAYYVEGLREIPRQTLNPIKMSFESEEYTKEEEVMLFVVSNSASIGGFSKLAPDASVSDGYLDVVVIKKSDIPNLAQIFINIFKGEHVKHPNVSYFKTKNLKVKANRELTVDIDGEYGGDLPSEFQVVPEAMEIFIL